MSVFFLSNITIVINPSTNWLGLFVQPLYIDNDGNVEFFRVKKIIHPTP